MGKDVIDVQHVGGYRLLLTFEGHEYREVDVESLILFDGVFEPLKELDFFRQVRVEPDVGTIVWPNGADVCPDVLYEMSRACPAQRQA
ncbi:MAG: DUF2442 domain-containing protein [Phycisphaerales bacterium]|nr:DUF2442 domain-containing protein [Phycisphaerales bacterium]